MAVNYITHCFTLHTKISDVLKSKVGGDNRVTSKVVNEILCRYFDIVSRSLKDLKNAQKITDQDLDNLYAVTKTDISTLRIYDVSDLRHFLSKYEILANNLSDKISKLSDIEIIALVDYLETRERVENKE